MNECIAVLGPKGTNSHEAAKYFFPDEGSANFVFCKDIGEIFSKVVASEVTGGVVPIHNNSKGQVDDAMRFWMNQSGSYSDQGVYPVMELCWTVKYSLMVHPDFPADGRIRGIHSHPQALGQCKRIIKELDAGEPFSSLSTAEAAERVAASCAEEMLAAIAPELAAQIYGLKVIKRNIQDSDENATTFHLIKKEETRPMTNCKTAVIFWLKNQTGSLVAPLNIISSAGRNMSTLIRLFSGSRDSAVFYVEFDGHVKDGVTANILGLIQSCTNKLVVLGSFPELLCV